MKNRLPLALVTLAFVGLAACSEDTVDPLNNNTVVFKATMTPQNEVPAVTVASNGTGTFTGVLDTVTNVFTYDVVFSGLTSGVNNGHIHGPADAGVAAGALLNFNTLPGAQFSFGATSGTAHGTVLLTSATTITATVNGDSLKKLLFAGKAYANIHTTSNSPGEIRGMIAKQ
jgi:hypothetical protein